jgi:hypothetical protein
MNPQTILARPAKSVAYTAAQLAVAARISKQTVLKSLAGIAAAENILVRGNETSAWTFDLLPPSLKENLAECARRNGMDIAGYLDAFANPWQPPVALAQVSASCLDDAKKLRAALLPGLQRMDAPMLTPTEKIRLGLEDYKRAFGHVITERHWRRLMDRTLRRDAGVEDFQKLEIYLPEKPACKADAKRLLPAERTFKCLTDLIQSFAEPNAPTWTEIAAFWAQVFEFYKSGANTKRELRALRRELVNFLFRHAPFLAESKRAVRVAFDRKFVRWNEQGESAAALLDGRELKRGEKCAPEIPQTDVDKIIWHAAKNYGGRVAPALRDFAASGERSGMAAHTIEIIARHHARKSQFNRRLMARVSNEIKNILPHALGKRAKDDAMAHVERDYSKFSSMEIVNADDFTLPVYFYVPDGNGWFTLVRGQCLLMLDVRSWKIIAWSLQPERNYNSLTIRTLMNRVCAGWGIPGTWYFERGIWKNSHVVKGTAPPGWNDAHSPLEEKIGWENLGVKFRHAIRARTKPVERVGGLLQDLMHGVRGYCGRNEKIDCPEVTKRAMDDLKFHRVNHPGELFLSFDEWHAQLGQLIDRYNATSQEGKVLQGLSPDEAFEKFWPHGNPPSRLDANSWHLLAHYVCPKPVTNNGICFLFGKKKFVYRNERTGQDRGKTVLAWFDPDSPDFLCVTDLNKKSPYLVERSMPVDFLAAPGDPNFEREIAKAASHSIYPRTRYTVLKTRFEPTFRRNIVDVGTAETAQEINRLRTEKVAEQKQVETERKKAGSNFRRLGMTLPERLRPGQADAARELSELFQKNEETPPSLENLDGKITYHLKPFGSQKSCYVDYLITRLTEFRKVGASFGQHSHANVTFGITKKIAQSQLKCDLHDESRFDEICDYLKAKIDATILGKRNLAKGAPNYHEFDAQFTGAQKEGTL